MRRELMLPQLHVVGVRAAGDPHLEANIDAIPRKAALHRLPPRALPDPKLLAPRMGPRRLLQVDLVRLKVDPVLPDDLSN